MNNLEIFVKVHYLRAKVRIHLKQEEIIMWRNHMEYLKDTLKPESSEPVTFERVLQCECEDEIDNIRKKINALEDEIKFYQEDLEYAEAALKEFPNG